MFLKIVLLSNLSVLDGQLLAINISCKKNEFNSWALLARDINLNDPNSDWWPLHTWSNDKALQYELSQPGRNKIYHQEIQTLGVTEALSIPAVEVFAFQEMSSNSGEAKSDKNSRSIGAPKNSKSIFDAVTSLMKSQAYELSALPHRKKDPSVYQFNLISINDCDLIRLKFNDEEIQAEQIVSEHYIARYIIKKGETFSRIRFIKATYFSDALLDYNRLHLANCKWFGQTYNKFYDGIVEDSKRSNLFIDEFRNLIRRQLFLRIYQEFKTNLDLKEMSLVWHPQTRRISNKPQYLAITVPYADVRIIEFLNQDVESKNHVADILKQIYRYSGDFKFDEDIPF